MAEDESNEGAEGNQEPAEEAQDATQEVPKPKENEQSPPWESDEEFDPDKAWRLIQNLRKEKDELKPLAERAKELEDAQKTEQQKLADALEDAKSEGSSAKAEAARLRAAIKYGLTEDDLELLGDGSPEEIEQRAEKLAARISPPSDGEAPAPSRRPQEHLRPGASPSSEPEKSPEELADAVMKKQRGF